MGRTESKQVSQQGMAQSSQDHANAQSALASANKSLAKHSSTLDSFMNFGRKTYGEGGEFQKTQNTIANTTAAAGTSGVAGNLALDAMRTGENTSNYAPTVAESARQSSRDLTSTLAGADADRLSRLTAINQFGVQASALPAEVQAGLYGRPLVEQGVSSQPQPTPRRPPVSGIHSCPQSLEPEVRLLLVSAAEARLI